MTESDPNATSRQSIVLIGPSGAGKSTAGKMLAERLGMLFVDLDDLRAGYYDDFGIDKAAERVACEQDGLRGLTTFWKPFELLSVERVVADYPVGHVIAFGAGQSVYRSKEDAARAAAALGPFRHVILLLPSHDVERTMKIIQARIEAHPSAPDDATIDGLLPLLREHVECADNRNLATSVVITGDRTIEHVVDALVQVVDASAG